MLRRVAHSQNTTVGESETVAMAQLASRRLLREMQLMKEVPKEDGVK